MVYITVPNTITTATTVLADPLDANFRAFENGLKDGTKDINLNQITVASTCTITGDITASGDFTIEGEDHGGKYVFPVALISSYSMGTEGDGYLGNSVGGTCVYSSVSQPVIMHNPGSVTNFIVHYDELTETRTGTVSFQLHVNGSSVASVLVTRSLATSWKQVSTITRNVASFSTGGKVAAYMVENASAAAANIKLNVFVEVQYD